MSDRSRLLWIAVAVLLGLAPASVAMAEGRVSGTNSATGAGSASAPSIGVNASAFRTAPTAIAAVSAGAQQLGSNRARVRQNAELRTGDSVAGSQVTGSVGDATVQESNSTVLALSFSGPIAAANIVVGGTGPLAVSVLAGSQASQFGDNDTDVSQTVDGQSGDALAESQVTGLVVSDVGRISNMNSGILGASVSGFVVGANATLLPIFTGPAAVDIAIGGSMASQFGSNRSKLDQANTGNSGDAVSGSQISGIVGSGTVVRVMESNQTAGVAAVSGLVLTANTGAQTVGPQAISNIRASAQQTGDNLAWLTQADDVASGDAVGGAQVTGVVAGDGADISIMEQQDTLLAFAVTLVATSTNTGTVLAGPTAAGLLIPQSLFAQASQAGNNAATVDQSSSATTGNALSAAQSTGAVGGDDSDVSISVQNRTGIPLAAALSGGAVSGSQVTGAVVGEDSDVTIQAGNSATLFGLSVAIAQASGATNIIPAAVAGPTAVGLLTADASQLGDDTVAANQVTNDVNAAAGLRAGPSAAAGSAAAPGPFAFASASQTGNDSLAINQEAVSGSLDALAGSQVAGVAAGGGSNVRVGETNAAIVALALTGAIPVTNTIAGAQSGPLATAGPTTLLVLESAAAQQTGNDTLTATQSIEAETGDALAGAQVSGVVGAATVDVSVSNFAALVLGLSGSPTATNIGAGHVGPLALATLGVARTSHAGDTALDGGQTFTAEAGDAVSGGQVTGRA